ncbi:DUF2625 domain-containing protein [Kribbella koreensis]|uniref:DUF2625 domain-containing protein n=1 Tax=Kribbella koreensis TaxID=57909 RepID=A0ABP4BLW2_9ACTN
MTDAAWPWILGLISSSELEVQILPGVAVDGQRCLAQLQVTERSALGGLALNSGGLVVDHGWIRVLGGSVANGNSMAEVNRFPSEPDINWTPQDGLVVGYDVLGGVFTLNGMHPESAGRPGSPGQILYFAPDTLEWDALPMTHSQWLEWLLSGQTTQFYESLRWSGWEKESQSLTLAQGISVYPFLWSAEAHADLAATSRRPVPFSELIHLTAEFTAQAALSAPGFLGSY